MKFNLNLRSKLLMQFLIIGVVPSAIIGGLAYMLASSSLETSALERLSSVQQVKKAAVERYFQRIKDQILTFSENQMIVDAAKDFKGSFHDFSIDLEQTEIDEMKKELLQYYTGDFATEYRNQNNGGDPNIKAKTEKLDNNGIVLQYHYIKKNENPLGSKHLLDSAEDGSQYSNVHNRVHPIVRSYLEKFGYYDIFIVDAETGHIIYSVFKELDYATSLISGPYADTNFAEAFRIANQNSKDFVVLVDYKQYSPSYEAPASFMASPIYDGDKKVAVAIFQMPIDRLNLIMGERSGMGESGETIIVGPDKLMRSDSHIDKDNRGVVASFRNPQKGQVNVPEVKKAIAGETGQGISNNYLGIQVLKTYTPVKVVGLTWAMLAQIDTKEAFAPARMLGYWMAGIFSVAVVLNLLFGSIIGRSIANPILGVAAELEDNANQVAGASDGLAGSSGKLSELAAQQASSIEETAASVEEIGAMVKNNVEQAEKSSKLSEQVKTVADKGNQSMQNLITSMQDIIASNQKIQELVKVIGEIGEKTEVIDEIVFQTKLLSFNASVEAERAGEHGRGFAVVAQEVGNLAQMSGKAALEIASMVKGSIKNAEAITAENKSKVEAGNLLVQETAKYLGEITADADILLLQAQQIVSASKEQADGISQVNEAMSQLDQATQQNSATAEGTASSSEELATQAEHLKDNVNKLLAMVEGTAKASALLNKINAEKNQNRPLSEPGVVNLSARRRPPPVQVASTEFKKAANDDLAGGDSHDNWEKL